MSTLTQKTIKEIITINGIGLHTGQEVNIKIKPAEPNTGVIFKRTDLKKNNYIIPNIFNVTNTNFCTTISNEFGTKVSTIEHLMAALFGMGVDNVLVEIDSEEVPILDGSAKEFVEKINFSGIETSNVPIKIIKIKNKVSIKDEKKLMSIEPSKISLDIDFEIKFNSELIGSQRNFVKVYDSDLTDIYNARTFCLYEDIEKLKAMNLAKGGNLDNALVVKGNKVLNKDGLRNDKEFVNHKILDCIGDLYLSGYKIIGKVICSQGGHKLTNQLLREVFQNKDNFSIIEIKEKSIPHSLINRKHLRSIA
tara:strand:+ start:125 stop:1045 length:921 start_codon:yes stop_codon:yes gene_type:complete